MDTDSTFPLKNIISRNDIFAYGDEKCTLPKYCDNMNKKFFIWQIHETINLFTTPFVAAWTEIRF